MAFPNTVTDPSKEVYRLVEMLDHVEKRVEVFRDNAVSLEKEKETLANLLTTLLKNPDLKLITENEREEVEATANRLLNRALAVEISVGTPRNATQVKALEKVETFIEELHSRVQLDAAEAKLTCQSYLNACRTDDHHQPLDQRFQALLIECTVDDQKKVRQRLESILTSLINVEIMSC